MKEKYKIALVFNAIFFGVLLSGAMIDK